PRASNGNSMATAIAAAINCHRSGRSRGARARAARAAGVIPPPGPPCKPPSIVEANLVDKFTRLPAVARNLGQRQRVDLHLAEARHHRVELDARLDRILV